MRDCRVVLVRPQFAENVGAVARIMRNFGFAQMVLVAPEIGVDERSARKLSTHGEDLLDDAKIAPDLESALRGCRLTVATSARVAGPRREPADFETAMRQLGRLRSEGPTALVFGPERTGLSNAELATCDLLTTIPANPDYPTLNLAQSVAICLYELSRQVAAAPPTAADEKDLGTSTATAESDFRLMLELLEQALTRIGYLRTERSPALMHALRRCIVRAEPTPMEISLFMGLARQILWYADRHSNEQVNR